MASIVLAMGLSHGPTVILEPEVWQTRAAEEPLSAVRTLNTLDGRFLSYAELLAEAGPRFARQATLENFRRQYAQCQNALNGLAADLDDVRPDVLLVIGGDQDELFSPTSVPALAVFCGSEIRTFKRPLDGLPPWRRTVTAAYGLDEVHTYPGAPEFGLEIVEGLIEGGFDVATIRSVPEPLKLGFGHAFGFVAERLMPGERIPMVPILVNTFRPPNLPTPRRCYELGRALRAIVEASTAGLRVGIVASGGLSHMLCERELDERVLEALRSGDENALCALPVAALQSGSAEIRAWIAMAGAIRGLRLRWLEYVPVYRTPVGSGLGAAFGVWQ